MKKKIGLVIIAIMIVFVGVNAQSHSLKYKLKKGVDYRFYQETKLNITQTLGFLEQEMKNDFKGITRFTPVGNEGNNIVLKASFESMLINVESLMFNMFYDSSKPLNPEDKMAMIYSKIVGEEFKMVISPQGEVIRIEGMNQIIDSAVNSVGNIQGSAANRLKTTLAGHFGEEALSGNMAMILSIYPEESKKIGESWKTETALTSTLKADLFNNWTLAGVSNDKWTLKGIGGISSSGQEAVINGMKVTFNLKGNQNADYVLNPNDGWFIRGKQEQKLEGTMVMNGNQQLPQGLEIPMKVTSSTYIEKR